MLRRIRNSPYPFRSIVRRTHQHFNPLLYPTLFVNEYPKSGGTWVCQMLSEALNWRFDDNRYPRLGPAVIKLHRAKLSQAKRMVLVRDPFDVALSFFHHHRAVYRDRSFNTGAVNLAIKQIFTPNMSDDEALDAFVEHIIQRPITPAQTWGEFYRKCVDRGDHILRYEDLRADAAPILARELDRLKIPVEIAKLIKAQNTHDIDTILANRGRAEGAFFVRSGAIGEGKRTLSSDACDLIAKDAGELLVRFGYER
ncbi:MAG: sulfotransferase domain-containing protein [Paracoccaceae bacterium]